MRACRSRTTVLAACLISLSLMPAAALALRVAPQERQLVTMTLVDRNAGATLPQYIDAGTQWVAGAPGAPYAIRLRNTTGARVLVVLSVDGVNVVSGETASPAQAGYVLAPWQTADIAGWRKSHADIARFEFAALADSYAARTGRPDHVGAIGIAVFEERSLPAGSMPSPGIARVPAPRASGQSAREAAASAADASVAQQRMGTGHGPREWAPTTSTTFVRASGRPAQVSTLRYDSLEALVARGIVPRRQYWFSGREPQAFPGRFVPDP